MNIAFVSSPLAPENDQEHDSFDFFAILLGGIVRHATAANHRVSVFVPRKQNATDSDQEEMLRGIFLNDGDFDAIVIAPFSTEAVKRVLKEYFVRVNEQASARSKGKDSARILPIAFVDKQIDSETIGVQIPSHVMMRSFICDNTSGGRAAADVLHDAFRRRGIPPTERRFMILRGLEGSQDRVDGFIEQTKAHYPDQRPPDIVQPASPHLNFTRGGARRWMDYQFIRLRAGLTSDFGSLDHPACWGIFACNDEMALGIRAFVANHYHRLRRTLTEATQVSEEPRAYTGDIASDYRTLMFLQEIRIVGFDGIAPALDLIQPSGQSDGLQVSADPWLIGTIDASVERQTHATIQWIIARRDHEATRTLTAARRVQSVDKVNIASVTARSKARQ